MTTIKPKKSAKKSAIEDAKIISEEISEKKIDDTIMDAEDLDNPLPKIDHVDATTPDDKKSERHDDIIMDGKDDKNLGTKKIDFTDSESVNSFVESPTKEYVERDDVVKEKKQESADEKIRAFENNMKMGPEEFQDLSGAGIDILETLVSSLLRWYAKDTVDAPYTISEAKKNRLKAQLSLIMMKYKMNFKIEWVFIFTLLVVFATPAKTAHEHRKSMKSGSIVIKPKNLTKK